MASGILTIDGSQGEGGGQVLRSSLALSLVTGRPFVIEKIRPGRKKPGLLRQHLTAVLAAAEVGAAEVEGAVLGSRRVVFRPDQVRPGDYAFRIGTAGSVTLVLQTVLPALLLAEGESNLTEAEHVTEVFTAFGKLGVRAEDVAAEALRQAEEYLAGAVPIGRHLADQIMLPLGIGACLGSGGGVFRTMELSLHATTHLEILRRFLEIDVRVVCEGHNNCVVRFG